MTGNVYRIWSNAPTDKSIIAFISVLRLHGKPYRWTQSPDGADIWCLTHDADDLSTAHQLYRLLSKKPAVAVLCEDGRSIPQQWQHLRTPIKASHITRWLNDIFAAADQQAHGDTNTYTELDDTLFLDDIEHVEEAPIVESTQDGIKRIKKVRKKSDMDDALKAWGLSRFLK